jgi:hypothetical protein
MKMKWQAIGTAWLMLFLTSSCCGLRGTSENGAIVAALQWAVDNLPAEFEIVCLGPEYLKRVAPSGKRIVSWSEIVVSNLLFIHRETGKPAVFIGVGECKRDGKRAVVSLIIAFGEGYPVEMLYDMEQEKGRWKVMRRRTGVVG